MGNRVILHAGAPKTGTTSLQFFFRDQEQMLAEQNIRYLPRWVRERDIHPIHKAVLQVRRGELRSKAIRQGRDILEEEFEQHPGQTLLISNESIFGEPFYEGETGFFPQADANMAAVAEMLAPFKVQLCLTVRETGSLLASYYGQAVRKGSFSSFDDFCSVHKKSSPSWLDFLTKAEGYFGTINGTTYSDFRANPSKACAALFGGNIVLPWENLGGRYNKNRSAGGNALAAMRWINGRLDASHDSGEVQKRRQAQRKTRDKIFTMLEYIPGGQAVALDHEVVIKFNQQYEHELVKIMGHFSA